MKRIVFYGDSITDAERSRTNDGYGGCGYFTLVRAELGYEHPGEYECLNRGISGNRIVDLYSRMKSDLINLKPDYISILIGVNDVWHEIGGHNGVSAEKFERVYDWMISEIKEALPNVKIMIMEPYVVRGTATDNCEEFPNRLEYFLREVSLRAEASKRIASKHGLLFVPLQKELDKKCAAGSEELWIADGVHPAPAGCELIKREWIKAFKQL